MLYSSSIVRVLLLSHVIIADNFAVLLRLRERNRWTNFIAFIQFLETPNTKAPPEKKARIR